MSRAVTQVSVVASGFECFCFSTNLCEFDQQLHLSDRFADLNMALHAYCHVIFLRTSSSQRNGLNISQPIVSAAAALDLTPHFVLSALCIILLPIAIASSWRRFLS